MLLENVLEFRKEAVFLLQLSLILKSLQYSKNAKQQQSCHLKFSKSNLEKARERKNKHVEADEKQKDRKL